jgi:hypothetical protein
MPSICRISRQGHEPIVDVTSTEAIEDAVRNVKPGTYVSVGDRILERVRVPVTVGIARTRTIAKLISDAAKPFGATAVLDRGTEESLLASHLVTDVTGIAGRREKRLLTSGIRTCLDLANVDRRLVWQPLIASGESPFASPNTKSFSDVPGDLLAAWNVAVRGPR